MTWSSKKNLVAMAMLALPLLASCRPDDGAVSRALRNLFSVGIEPLSEDARLQLERFGTIISASADDASDVSAVLTHFSDALTQVRREYVRPVDEIAAIDAAFAAARNRLNSGEPASPQDLVDTALDGMLKSLDPHSNYMNPQSFEEFEVQIRGEFGGLGIEIAEKDGLIRVISPIEETPAARAGIMPGDAITRVDGNSIQGIRVMDAVRRMRGPPGTMIRLTIQRDGVPDFEVILERAIIQIRPVRWHMENDIGYLRVSVFNEQVKAGIEHAMEELKRGAGGKLAGLVIDLRANPGGRLDQSVWMSDAFIDQGLIVETRGRHAGDRYVYEAEAGDLIRNVPILVLVNVGSASAAEIVAAALQDSGRALVMGTRTYGKGSVQTIFPLPREGGLRLTTALHYRPSGQSIQALGVLPDIVITSEKVSKISSEADLPGAISSDHQELEESRLQVPEASCPSRDDGDFVLGCALLFLKSGGELVFLDALGRQR
jgi:carboxyl-terminal processing protease